MKNTYLHYTKTQKLLLKSKTSPKIKNCFVLDLYRGIYRHMSLLEDETGPRVENRRVAPPLSRGSAAITADPRPNQGVISLVLVRGCVVALGASWYILFLVISPEYSSDVSKGLGSTYLLENSLLGLQLMRI